MESRAIFSELLKENLHGLVLYARQWTEPFAEDIVQEAFLKLFQENPIPRFPKAWLFRVVRNLAIDCARRENRTTPLSEEHLSLEKPWFEDNETQEDVEQLTELTELLRTLEEPIREIVVAKIWGNLTFREIAELQNRPISSVHADYQQGLARLRTLFETDL